MSCAQYRSKLLPWLKRELPEASVLQVEQHVSVCPDCARAADSERAVLEALRDQQRIPAASSDFQARVLSAATGRKAGGIGAGHARAWSTPAFGGAVAAALVLGIALGFGLQPGESLDSPAPSLAGENTAPLVPEPRNVRLAFSSSQALDDVTLTVELPPHVEMASYPGHQQLSWKVDLDKGENVVNLPLNVLFAGQGELVARINDGDRTQTFRANLSEPGKLDNRLEPSS
jgi:hypothetical protein